MRIATWLVTVVLLSSVAATQHAWAEKITVDPNVPGSLPAQVADPTDERVAQKVTYKAEHKPVREILSEVENLTGVKLYAGYNPKDWQVRDRRMNVFVKDIPLAHVMNSIARAMKFKWSKNDDKDPPTYRLYMDRRSLLAGEAQRRLEEQRYDKRMAQKRENLVAECAKLVDLSAAEVEQLRTQNPYLHMMAVSGLAQVCAVLAGGSPAVLNALAAGNEVTLDSVDLTQADQEKLLRAVNDANAFLKKIIYHADGSPREAPDPITGQITVQLARTPELHQWSGNETFLGFMKVTQDGLTLTGFPIRDPESSFARMVGRSWTTAWDEDRPEPEVWRELMDEVVMAVSADRKKNDSGEPRAEHADDPRLHAEVELGTGQEGKPYNFLQELAEATGLGVVSDSFGTHFSAPGCKGKEMELEEILDAVAAASQCNWWLHGPMVEFRDRHWFRKRAAQIPDAWLDAWKKTFKETGTLDIVDLAQIAALTEEQWRVNIWPDEVLGPGPEDMWDVFSHRSLVHIYAFLNESQRFAASSELGLDLRMVSPDYWQRIRKGIGEWHPEFLADPEAELRLFCTRSRLGGKQFHYKFRITTSDVFPPIEWKITTPRYYEPKRKTEDEEKDGSEQEKTQDQPGAS